MIQDEYQNSGSSKDDDELVIKPLQTSPKLHSLLHHKNKKKRKHSKEHKSLRKHHHHHKSSHLKSSNAESYSKRNQNMKSESYHYRDYKGKDQIKEYKEDLVNRDITDVRHIRLFKDIRESRRYSNGNEKRTHLDNKGKDQMRESKEDLVNQNVTDVRHVRPFKDVRENRRYNNKNERTLHFCDEMKIEWRKKRILWLQHQKNQDEKISPEKEKNQRDKNNETKSKEYKSRHLGYSKSQSNYFQIDDEKYCNSISSVSSGEESVNHEENKKREELIDEENEHVSDQEDTAAMSDISNSDNDAQSRSEGENVESESPIQNGHFFLQKENPTESAEEIKANAKHAEENETIAISPQKCLEPVDILTPKRPVYCPAIQGCRSINIFHILNRIEEGTYGVVYRARDKETKEIVALKRLKMEREKEGFPITSLREINTLLKAQHSNIVTVREIVVGSHMDRIYIVMDYVEHDLKSLMKTMPRAFLIGEVKTLLLQLLCAVAHLHDNWILHRDLKTSNLLLSHQGILKVGDFGLAREYGSPLKSYTPVVVTLWYRAPELLLGAKKYSTPIDMWSVGCIFSELLLNNPLFPGKSEYDQINRIFKILGTPSERIWPGYSELPLVKSLNITQYPYNNLKRRFSPVLTDIGFDLLNKFLTYNPDQRISAEKAKSHQFFNETPTPVPPNMFPTWPAKSEQEHHATARSKH